MPVFQSPEGQSDGGYAVSDFRKVDSRFGTLEDLKKLQQNMMSAEYVPDARHCAQSYFPQT